MKVSGKTIFITGAASGIGRALAIEGARRGATLALADVDLGGLGETRDLIAAETRNDARCTLHKLDVSSLENWQTVRDDVLAVHGHVDGIINNAGITFAGPVEDTGYDRFERVMAINFMGTVYGTKEFLPALKLRPEAVIANVSSVFGLFPMKKQAAYCASKYAVRGFTEVLHQELKGSGILVSSIHPGHIATKVLRNAVEAGNTAGVDLPQAHQDFIVDAFEANGLPASTAARIILDGIAGGRRKILVGKDAQRSDWRSRLFPKSFVDRTNRDAV
nr:SDR family NAD(P)-dependent oxidoreductase [Hyphomonas sp. Mor2]